MSCETGYFLEIHSLTCKSCAQKYPIKPELVVDCWMESSDLDNWKFEVQSFFQNFIPKRTQLVISGFQWIQRYGIKQCVQNYQVLNQDVLYQDVCVPACGDNCNICQQYESILTCKQCNYQFEEYEILSYFDSMCQACPYPCRLCEPRSLSEIQAINPYFIVNETNKQQTHRCLLNFDDENSFIQTKSGQVRGKNSQLHARFLIQYFPQAIIDYSSLKSLDSDYLIRRKVANSVITFLQNDFDSIINLRSTIFSIENTTTIVDGSQHLITSQEIYNQTKVNIINYIMGFSNYYILIAAKFGVEIVVQNFTIHNLDYVLSVFQISDVTSLSMNSIKFVDSNFTSSALINVSQIVYQNQVNIIIGDFLIQNCTFSNSSIFYIQTNNVIVNKFVINKLNIINSTFVNTSFINELNNLNITELKITNVSLQNCFIESSVFFYVPQTIQGQIYDFHLNKVILKNSTLIQIVNSFLFDNISISFSKFQNSYLILCPNIVVVQQSYTFQFLNIIINNLSIKGQTLILVGQNTKTGMKKINLVNINLKNILEDSSEEQMVSQKYQYYLFYFVGDYIAINNYYNLQQGSFVFTEIGQLFAPTLE